MIDRKAMRDDWAKNNRLQREYGLSIDEYKAMLRAQGDACAICAQPPGERSLAVDHDHETGEVRGLLCSACNAGLGMFGDSSPTLIRAWEYLQRDFPEGLTKRSVL